MMKASNRRRAAQLSRLLASLLIAALALPAAAHPGHGPFEQGPWHALTSPYHLALMLLTGGACLLVGQIVRQPRVRRALNWAGTGAVVLSVVLFGAGYAAW